MEGRSRCINTYGSAKIPGVSSCEETQPAPVLKKDGPLVVCGQSANKPSQTPKQVLSLQSSALPIVSTEVAGIGGDTSVIIVVSVMTPCRSESRRE